MARLGPLLLLLLLLWKPSDAWACYCTSPQLVAPDGRQYCIANPECWACVPGAYDPNWQSLFCGNYIPPAPTCTYSAITEQRACPANYSGTETWKKETNCVNGSPVESAWFKIGSTCTPNPPTCQTGSEAKTESCQAGFVGQKSYARQSVCQDPYGQAIWGQWNLVSDTCTKSVTNPTNPLSPVSPISAPAIMSAPAIVPAVPVPMMTPESTQETASQTTTQETQKADSAPQSQTKAETSDAPATASSAPASPAGSGARAAALVQRLTMIGALRPQPNIIETLTLAQELPNDIRRQQNFLVDLIANDDDWRALGDDQRARFGGILWSNPLQSGYDSD
jgi:hypothetical protein